MKLNSLTHSKKKGTDKQDKTKFIPNVPFSLAAEVSKRYEGNSDNILGVVNGLPEAIRAFFKDSELKAARFKHDRSVYQLVDTINTYYVDIQEVRVGGKAMYHIRIKMNGKWVFRNYTRKWL